MSDSEPPANSYDRERQELHDRLLEIYIETREIDYLASAFKLRKPEYPMTLYEHRYQKYFEIDKTTKNSGGRPEIPDDYRVLEVLLHTAIHKWPRWKGALFVAKKISPPHYVVHTARRLTRKLRKIERDLKKPEN